MHGSDHITVIRWLYNFRTSLTELRLSNYFGKFVDLGVVLPLVRSLEFYTFFPFPYNLRDVAHAFPNIRRLVIQDLLPSRINASPSVKWPFLDFASTWAPRLLGRTVRHLHFRTPSELILDDSTLEPLTHEVFRQSSPVVLGCRAEAGVLRCMVSNAPTVRFLQVFDLMPFAGGPESLESFLQHMQHLVVCITSVVAPRLS